MTTELVIDKTWDGTPLPADHRALVQLVPDGPSVMVRVFAPSRMTPHPKDRQAPPRTVESRWCSGSWLARRAVPRGRARPHGHHLVLALRGVRPIRRALPIVSTPDGVARDGGQGPHGFPAPGFPRGAHHQRLPHLGRGAARHYHAHVPVPALHPTFTASPASPSSSCPSPQPPRRSRGSGPGSGGALGRRPLPRWRETGPGKSPRLGSRHGRVLASAPGPLQ